MTEEQAINEIVKHMNSQFPKKCSNCGKLYKSYKDFLINAKRVGNPVPHDDDEKLPKRPIGTYTYYNCECNTTIVIGSRGMNLVTILNLMLWGRKERKKRGITLEQLLIHVRESVDKTVLESHE